MPTETISGLQFITWSIVAFIVMIFVQKASIWRAKARKFDELQRIKKEGYIPTIEELLESKAQNKILDAIVIMFSILMPKIGEYIRTKRLEMGNARIIENLKIRKTLDEVI